MVRKLTATYKTPSAAFLAVDYHRDGVIDSDEVAIWGFFLLELNRRPMQLYVACMHLGLPISSGIAHAIGAQLPLRLVITSN